MKNLREIKSVLGSRKKNLIEKYPIKTIAIFGSFARNEQTSQSDLDILVEFNDKIGVGFIQLADDLESYLNMKVDLISKKGLKSKYLEAIEPDLIYV